MSVLKKSRIYMYGNGLVVFGVFWGGLGYFEAVGFQKRIKRIICTVMDWWYLGWFGGFWVGLGYFEAVGFLDWFPSLIKLHFRYAYNDHDW